jgi:hypothetical protein
MQESARKWRRKTGPATVTPLPRGISTIGRGRYTGSREPDAPPSHAQVAHSGQEPLPGLLGAPTLAYRCGGSTGISPVSRLTRCEKSRAGTRSRVRGRGLRIARSPRVGLILDARAGPLKIRSAMRQAPAAGRWFCAPCQPLKHRASGEGGGNHYRFPARATMSVALPHHLDAKQHSKMTVSS